MIACSDYILLGQYCQKKRCQMCGVLEKYVKVEWPYRVVVYRRGLKPSAQYASVLSFKKLENQNFDFDQIIQERIK